MKKLSTIKWLLSAFLWLVLTCPAAFAQPYLPEYLPQNNGSNSSSSSNVWDTASKSQWNPTIPGVTTPPANTAPAPTPTSSPSSSSSSTQEAKGGDVFSVITQKALATLSDLRNVLYVIAGFGLVVVAWGAIFGKISFKHLSTLSMGLFLLAVTAPFIEYFTGQKPGVTLGFGNYLDSNYQQLLASDDLSNADCVKGSDGKCTQPDAGAGANVPSGLNSLLPTNISGVTVPGLNNNLDGLKNIADANNAAAQAAAKKSFGLSDILGAVKSGAAAVTTAANYYTGAKAAINQGQQLLKNTGGALSGMGSGNILDRINSGANAALNVAAMGSLGAYTYDTTLGAAGQFGNQVQDASTNNVGRAINNNARNQGTSTNALNQWATDTYNANKPAVNNLNNQRTNTINSAADVLNVTGQITNAKNAFGIK